MSPCSMKLWTSQIRSISFRTELSEEIMTMVSRNLLCLTPFLIRQDKDSEALNERLQLAKTKLESCPPVSNLWQWLPGIGDNYPGTEYNIVQSRIAYDSELLKWLVSSPHPLVIGSPWQWDIIPQLQMIQPFKSHADCLFCLPVAIYMFPGEYVLMQALHNRQGFKHEVHSAELCRHWCWSLIHTANAGTIKPAVSRQASRFTLHGSFLLELPRSKEIEHHVAQPQRI